MARCTSAWHLEKRSDLTSLLPPRYAYHCARMHLRSVLLTSVKNTFLEVAFELAEVQARQSSIADEHAAAVNQAYEESSPIRDSDCKQRSRSCSELSHSQIALMAELP